MNLIHHKKGFFLPLDDLPFLKRHCTGRVNWMPSRCPLRNEVTTARSNPSNVTCKSAIPGCINHELDYQSEIEWNYFLLLCERTTKADGILPSGKVASAFYIIWPWFFRCIVGTLGRRIWSRCEGLFGSIMNYSKVAPCFWWTALRSRTGAKTGPVILSHQNFCQPNSAQLQ